MLSPTSTIRHAIQNMLHIHHKICQALSNHKGLFADFSKMISLHIEKMRPRDTMPQQHSANIGRYFWSN